MRLNLRLKTMVALEFLLIFAFAAGVVHAAPQDITMTPTSNSPTINPGATYNSSFQVVNQGNSGYNFQVYGAPYHVSGEDYTPDFTILPHAPNPSSWFTFSIGASHLPAGQLVKVNYAIAVPAGTAPGAYFAVAFAQTQFPKVPNSISLNERVGEIFYIRVAGPVTQGGKLLTWSAGLFQESPLTSTIRIEDSGELNFPATIQVKVADIFGQSKYTLNTIKEVLPQTIRRVDVPWEKSPSLGLFKVSGTVNFLNHTQKLPTKWVLIMSRTVRVYLLAVVAVIILVIVTRVLYRLTPKSKRKPKKN